MANTIQFHIDDGGVEYTDYVQFNADTCRFIHENALQVMTGYQGGNTYPGESQRYTKTWTITANVGRRVHDALMGYADDAFAATTKLRVYDKYAAPLYTDYTGVKLKSYSYTTASGFQRFNITLVVTK